MERLKAAPISRIVVTDTVPVGERAAAIRDRLTVLSVGDMLGDAIHNIHHNLSISALFRDKVGPKR